MSDVTRLRRALADVEKRAADLPWAKERRWRTKTHVGIQGGMPVVDLHDLSVRLALAVVEVLFVEGGKLDAPAVVLVTGRGRHNPTGRSELRDAVTKALADQVGGHGWRLRPRGPGRLLLVLDPARAPGAKPGVGLLAVAILLLAAAVAVALAKLLG